jgi:hypothetical protein
MASRLHRAVVHMAVRNLVLLRIAKWGSDIFEEKTYNERYSQLIR